VRAKDLLVVAVKSRPAGVTVLGRKVIAEFRERPPSEWGGEYAEFLKELGLSHLAATVSLPRGEVIVRQIQLPPASGKELAAAVHYQIDTLHPFGEDEVYYAHAPLREIEKDGGETPVGVVIAEKTKVDSYADLFEAANIAVSSFSVTAAAFYAGVRIRWDSPPVPFLITDFRDDTVEIYGEGRVRPLFSVSVLSANRALQLAGADLRLEQSEAATLAICGGASREASEDSEKRLAEQLAVGLEASFEPKSITEILPAPATAPPEFEIRRDAAALTIALEAACPRVGWRANLLPPERRKSSSRWMYAPTAALATLLLVFAIAFAVRPSIQDHG
jgi:hypothetical protein